MGSNSPVSDVFPYHSTYSVEIESLNNLTMKRSSECFNQPNKYKLFNEESVSRGRSVSWIVCFSQIGEFPGRPRRMHADEDKSFFQL
jgi:hypothetical protein